MKLQVDVERLLLAHKALRAELLAERNERGEWVGHIASSPVATATAISALVVAHRGEMSEALRNGSPKDEVAEQLVQHDLSELLLESVHWLARHQNPDGGWGDCASAQSNVGATMLVQAACRLTGVPAKYADLVDKADAYVEASGGVSGLRRLHSDNKPLVAAILANCALAGTVSWRQVPTLAFELLSVPDRWKEYAQLPYPPYSKSVILAVGRAKFQHDPPRNPLTRLWRRSMCSKSAALVAQLQAEDDSFLASIPATAFIVMCLASSPLKDHRVIARGVEFLLSSVRPDASWAITTDLAVRNTVLALEGLEGDARRAQRGPERVLTLRAPWDETPSAALVEVIGREPARPAHTAKRQTESSVRDVRVLEWLLDAQRADGGAGDGAAGGWSASASPGALVNTYDTAAAVAELVRWALVAEPYAARLQRAVRQGIEWLLSMQSLDGSWRTFYADELHGGSAGPEVTAGALRALALWRRGPAGLKRTAADDQRADEAIATGWRYLESTQRADGSFVPLWFGNEYQPDHSNPVIGTASVLLACSDLEQLRTKLAETAASWLMSAQHTSGGWGPPRAPRDYSNAEKDGFRAWRANETLAKHASVEETALAVRALLPFVDRLRGAEHAVSSGVEWLLNAIEQDAHRRAAVIGYHLPKLWYYERLYPLVFAAGALSPVVRQLALEPHETAPVG